MEVRDVSKKNPQAVREALEAVRRSVISETGLTPSRVVSVLLSHVAHSDCFEKLIGCG